MPTMDGVDSLLKCPKLSSISVENCTTPESPIMLKGKTVVLRGLHSGMGCSVR